MIRKIVLSFLLFLPTLKVQAAFDENGRRYLSGSDLYWSLQSIFADDGAVRCGPAIGNGFGEDPIDAASGEPNPGSGEPISGSPTPATISAITTCLAALWTNFDSKYRDGDGGTLFLIGPALSRFSSATSRVDAKSKWSQLPVALRLAVVEHHIEMILGPDALILDYGLLEDVDQFRTQLLSHIDHLITENDGTLEDAVKLLFLNLVLRDEFLSY